MKLKDLSPILWSQHTAIQNAILYNRATDKDEMVATIDYMVANYPEANIIRIQAQDSFLVLIYE